MKYTASSLRQNIYQVLDQSIETGTVVEIVRKGKVVRLVPPQPENKLAKLRKRKIMKEDPENYVHCDWSKEWKF
jgi:prevent-host-death family protein